MGQCQGRLADQAAPHLFFKNANDLGVVRQGMKQALDKAQSCSAILFNQFERSYMYRIDAHLTVAYDPVTGELETGNAIFFDTHAGISGI